MDEEILIAEIREKLDSLFTTRSHDIYRYKDTCDIGGRITGPWVIKDQSPNN